MHARISTFLGSPGRFDTDLADARENILPAFADVDGFRGLMILNDQASGRSVAITFWNSEDDLRASEERLRAFYSGLLGMAEIAKPPALAARGGCWFRAGGCVLHLGVEEGFRPPRKAHPGIRVSGLPELAARLERAGLRPAWDEELPGHRRCYVADPVGNRLELLEPGEPGEPVEPR
jgi:catechol 2,3-dioxygenase-like lactoylglutathione lyase family enzyme